MARRGWTEEQADDHWSEHGSKSLMQIDLEEAIEAERIKDQAFSNILAKYEERTVVLSTAHIPQDLALRLGVQNTFPDLITYEKKDCGWWFYIGDDCNHAIDTCPAINPLLIAMHHAGVKWVMFDRDGDTLEGFPTYAW